MKYLLTGGAGFIGSHLADELLKQNHTVCIVDDLSTGAIKNIQHLKSDNGFQYVIESVFNKAVMAELVDEADIVLHLAAAVGVRLIVESPVRTIETNIKGTEVVLELAAKKKKTVVVFSTSEVYGKSNGARFSETGDLVLGPTYKGRWSYAASKIIDEFLDRRPIQIRSHDYILERDGPVHLAASGIYCDRQGIATIQIDKRLNLCSVGKGAIDTVFRSSGPVDSVS